MAQKALERSKFGVAGRAIKKRKTEIWLELLILERDRLDYLLCGKGRTHAGNRISVRWIDNFRLSNKDAACHTQWIVTIPLSHKISIQNFALLVAMSALVLERNLRYFLSFIGRVREEEKKTLPNYCSKWREAIKKIKQKFRKKIHVVNGRGRYSMHIAHRYGGMCIRYVGDSHSETRVPRITF